MTALTPVYETSGCEVATAIPQDRTGRPAPRPYRRIRKRSDRGVAQPPEYTLFCPSTCPTNQDHLTHFVAICSGRAMMRNLHQVRYRMAILRVQVRYPRPSSVAVAEAKDVAAKQDCGVSEFGK